MSKKRKSKKKVPTKSFLRKYGVPGAVIPGIIVASMLGFDYEKLIKTPPKNNPEIFATNVQVVEVSDGDTVQLEKGLPVRLVGIDAPEKGKHLYNESRVFLMEILGKKKVEVEYIQRQNDNYGRLRGYLFVNCDYENQKYCEEGKLNVSEVMVGNGMAEMIIEKSWVKLKPDYTEELKKAENEAKSKKLGLWSLHSQGKLD